jgi:hypothetical protein
MKLLPSLLAGLKAVCAAFPDPRKGRGGNIAMADFGLSAFAMFFVRSALSCLFNALWRRAMAGRIARATQRSNGKVESYHSMLAATVVAPGHAKSYR